jgi:hypothetical protein
MDNHTKIGSPDNYLINLNENYEVEYWSDKFGVKPEVLKKAVDKVGIVADDVQAYFSKK